MLAKTWQICWPKPGKYAGQNLTNMLAKTLQICWPKPGKYAGQNSNSQRKKRMKFCKHFKYGKNVKKNNDIVWPQMNVVLALYSESLQYDTVTLTAHIHKCFIVCRFN